jgi:hypothetical protein
MLPTPLHGEHRIQYNRAGRTNRERLEQPPPVRDANHLGGQPAGCQDRLAQGGAFRSQGGDKFPVRGIGYFPDKVIGSFPVQ